MLCFELKMEKQFESLMRVGPVHHNTHHVKTMANLSSQVTIHMAASLDGFIARKDGRVDWLETSDEFIGGASPDPSDVEAFLKTIDYNVMDSNL
jgi:hypothetical protein